MKLKERISAAWPSKFHPCALAERAIERASRGQVFTGPFAGMRYVNSSLCSSLSPKLLGIYECELADLVEALCKHSFARIVDVGAAEGYYAVGFAYRSVTSEIVAFETVEEGQRLIRRMAEMNGVSERVSVRGQCTVSTLGAVLNGSKDTLVVMDVEGAEEMLLCPDLLPQLSRCHLLVELHDFISRGISSTIKTRFEKTHAAKVIWSRDRTVCDLPIRSIWLDRWLIRFAREFRPEQMQWIYLKPTAGVGGPLAA